MSETVSKAKAEYQDEPNGEEHCYLCTMFREPDRCTYVRGEISPRGWCRYFEGEE